MLSSSDIAVLLAWDRIAKYFHTLSTNYQSGTKSIKNIVFSEVYGELIKKILNDYLSAEPKVLKTDLWNEGIETDRNLAKYVHKTSQKAELVGQDISRIICEYAKQKQENKIEIVRSTLLASPFHEKFDLILDVSTVDHIPEKLRRKWILNESNLLKKNGILLISFDSKLNIFCELFHRLATRKLYPEWTLIPSNIRYELVNNGFEILHEHSVFILGLFFGTHRPWFPLARLLKNREFITFIKKIELSKYSKILTFLAPQYVFVARKKSD